MRRNKTCFLVGAAFLCLFLLTGAHAWAAENTLQMKSFAGNVGDTVKVAVQLANPDTVVGGLQFALTYDAALLDAVGAEAAPELPEMTFEDAAGVLRVVVLNTDGNTVIGKSADLRAVVYVSFAVTALPTEASALQLGDVVLSDVGGEPLAVAVKDGVFPNGLLVGSAEGGPGQAVQIPITLINSDTLGALQFTLDYDETILSFVGSETGAGAPSASAYASGGKVRGVVLDVSAPGGQDILEPDFDGLVLLTLSFEVAGTAVTGTKSPLTLESDAIFSDVEGIPIDGSVGSGTVTVIVTAENVMVSPDRIEFTDVPYVGQEAWQDPPLQFEIKNVGAGDLTQIDVVSSDPSFSATVPPGFSGTLASKESGLWTVKFTPQAAKTYAESLMVYSSAAPAEVPVVYVSGTGKERPQPPTASFTVQYLGTPTAAFTASPESGTLPLDVTFTNQSTDTYNVQFTATTDPNVVTYSWSFGDGTSGGGASTKHVYSPDVLPKTYPVTLTATGKPGTAPATATKEVAFDLTYEWDFGDQTPTSTETSPIHTYIKADVHTAKLTVTGAAGRIDTETKTIEVAAPPAPVVIQLVATPEGTTTLELNETADFTVTATYSNDSTAVVTGLVTWTYTGDSIGTIDATGKFTPANPGTMQALATLDGESSNTLTITVNVPTLVSIAVSPPSATILKGETADFAATGTFSDESTNDITAEVDWSSSADGIATVDAGTATGVGGGTATISAAHPDAPAVLPGTATLNVLAAKTVTVTPSTVTVLLGRTQQFAASVTYSTDGIERTEALDPTQVTWGSSPDSVAQIDANGEATALKAGQATITATFDGVVGTAELTVRSGLVSIAVEPKDETTPAGLTKKFTATATFDIGDPQDVTQSAAWTSDPSDVAEIVAKGSAKGLKAGDATIKASFGGQDDTATLHVVPAIPTSIEIVEGDTTVPLGAMKQYTARATLSDGTAKSVTDEAIWSSSVPAVASVDGKGLVMSKTRGATQITAKINTQLYQLMTEDVVSAPRTVTVGAPAVVSVAVTPETAEVAAGLTYQFGAEATYTDNSKKNVTGTAEWSSSAEGVAGVDAGLATAKAQGTAQITATVDGVPSDPATLTVTAPAPEALAVNPGDMTRVLVVDETIPYTAEVTYTNDSTAVVDAEWGSSAPDVASVDPATGVVTLHAAGITEIKATFGTLSAVSKLILTEEELVSIYITPENPTILFGQSTPFTANGVFGTATDTLNITSLVDWSSDAPGVATVDNGLAVSTGVGVAKISATIGSISSPTQDLTVNPASIAVTPKSPVIGVNKAMKFQAMALSEDGKQQRDVTATATWASSDGTVAFHVALGEFLGSAGGTTNITAELLSVTSEPVVLSVDATPPNILGRPSGVGIDTSAVAISWITDEKSTSVVQYDGVTKEDTAKVTNHSVIVTGLTADTRYSYQVQSEDRFGNPTVFTDPDTVRTLASADTKPPQFVVLPAATPQDSSMLVRWETDELSKGEVRYGLTSGYGSAVQTPSFAAAQTVELTGLEPQTTYHFSVVVWDLKRETTGETASQDRTVTTLATPDTVAPKILSGPGVVATTQSGATVVWHTSEAGNSLVEYGLTNALGLLKEGPENVMEHTVTLTNLMSDTTYYYRVGTEDLAGNGPTYSDPIATLRTEADKDTTKPVIVSGPSVLATSNVSATIVYDTNEPTDTRVEYGLAAGLLGLTAGTAENVRAHSVTLTNLEPDTTYFYRVVATDLSGNARTTGAFSFPTKAEADDDAPNITQGPIEEVQDSSATILWRTNEPSTSQIVYHKAGSPTEVSVGDPAPVVEHRITLFGLSSGTNYQYTVISEDLSPNQNRMEKTGYKFKTLTVADTTPPDISKEKVDPDAYDAAIKWKTSEDATRTVRYGFSRDELGFEETDLALTRRRKGVTLTNLAPSTRYYFMLVSVDAAGNVQEKKLSPDWFETLAPDEEDVAAPVLIEGPAIPYRADTRAVITWVTDEDSDSRVFYRPVGAASYSFFVTSRTETQYHSLTITDLVPGEGYQFAIVSVDGSGNPLVYPQGSGISMKAIRRSLHDNYALAKVLQLGGGMSFETLLEPDTQWPVITSGPTIVANTTGSPARVTIEWTTDEPSDSELEYGDLQTASGEDVTVHRMVLVGLETGTSYSFRVGSTDPSDNGATFSSPSVFTTATEADVEPPIISEVEELAVADQQATVRWQTDEVSDSKVAFGLSPDNLNQARGDPTDVTDHKIALTNLVKATTYYYRVTSVDFADNLAVGAIEEFTTATEADEILPVISDVAVMTTGPATVLITWKTSELADSYVKYGPDASLGLEVQSLTDVLEHEVALSNLESDAETYYSVRSTDRAGNESEWTLTETFIPVVDEEPPAAPTGFGAIPGNERVFLRWQANIEPDLAGYDVYRSIAGAAAEKIAAMVTAPTYTDQSAENGVEYTYSVTALDRVIPTPNVSAASEASSATPEVTNVPGPPSGIDPTLLPRSEIKDGVRVSGTTRPWLVVQSPTELGASLPEAGLTYGFVIASDPDFDDVLASSTPDQLFGKDMLALNVIGDPSKVGEDWVGWQVPGDLLDANKEYWWRARAKKGDVLVGLWMAPEHLLMAQVVAVELTAFAGYEDRGDAVIEWATAREYGHAGFNLYRSTTEDGTYRKITPELITGENPYRYRDETVKPDRTYFYRLEAVDLSGFGQTFGPVAIRVSAPKEYSLAQNYPNPFNPETAIEYDLPRASDVMLTIYNLTGQEVMTLVRGRMDAGRHAVLWDGRDRNGVEMASGIYFYRIKAGEFVKTRKMVLVK